MPPQITLYSELHPHIRQLSLAASLPTPISSQDGDSRTRALITSSGTVFTIRHGDSTASLKLPAAVKPGEVELAIPPVPQHQNGASGKERIELSWRLALMDEGTSARALANGTAPAGSEPWSASDLVAGSAVKCRGCEAVLLRDGKVKNWKDLPSEGWAEMMDFWHCHKPHDHDEGGCEGGASEKHGVGSGEKASEESLAARAYGANSAIVARSGVGFVGLMEVLLDEGDVEGVVYSTYSFDRGHPALQEAAAGTSSQRRLNIFCAACQTQLGHYAQRTSSTTLLKWQVRITSSLDTNPTLSTCLVAALVATHARSGSAKSLILPYSSTSSDATTESAVHAIHIWLFNARTRYASNNAHPSVADQMPVPAAKVFFRLLRRAEAEKMVEGLGGAGDDAQEIELPEDAVRALGEALTESNLILPAKERMFKDWKVGLLERWTDDG